MVEFAITIDAPLALRAVPDTGAADIIAAMVLEPPELVGTVAVG